MQGWARRYSIVIGIGFVIYVFAVGLGAATGEPLATREAWPLSLRYLGGGLFVGGLALGIANRRIEGNRPGLNPMFGLLLAFSTILLVIGAIVAAASGETFLLGMQAGLVSAVAALGVGLLAMLISAPEPVTQYDYPWMDPDFDSTTDAYASGLTVPTTGYGPDDLTRIEGVDEQIADLLREAGVRYFSQLANSSLDELLDVLESGGLLTMDPSSWSDQAMMAANGDWDALAAFQERLTPAEAA